MRAIAIAVSFAAAAALIAQASAQGTSGGATGGATSGSAGASAPPSATPSIQAPAPFAGRTNPGTRPGAPGPSQAHVPRGISPTVRQPGYASSHRQPRASEAPRDDASSSDAVKELDKELDRKLSICRGC